MIFSFGVSAYDLSLFLFLFLVFFLSFFLQRPAERVTDLRHVGQAVLPCGPSKITPNLLLPREP